MLSVQDFKNATTIGLQTIMLVDDVNDNFFFGYTKSIKKVSYNLALLNNYIKKEYLNTQLSNTNTGLTILFPLGRYITILKIKKDESEMSMMFLDFTIDDNNIDMAFKDDMSDNFISHFKHIKHEMEEHYEDSWDTVILDTKLEPPNDQENF